MTRNKTGRPAVVQSSRVFRLAPTTRAVRLALAGSAPLLALALAASGSAYAGSCTALTDASGNFLNCDGDFTDTVPGAPYLPLDDTTLVIGANAPTTVTPGAGSVGVLGDWAGAIGIVNHGAIETDGADGIHVYGSTAGAAGTIDNLGSVHTVVSATGANGVDINVYGDATINNSGDLTAVGTGVFDVTTVTAYSVEGVTTVNNLAGGSISAEAADGNALAVNAFGFYGSVVNNAGDLSSHSVGGTATGVFIEAFKDATGGGTGVVNNTGSLSATSDTSSAVGIDAFAQNTSLAVTNDGHLDATGATDAIGIRTYAPGTTVIGNGGDITVTSSAGSAAGISAASDWERITIDSAGDITANAFDQASGIVSAGYWGDINVSGNISATSVNGAATGILSTDYNESNIINSGTITAGSTFSTATGIHSATALLVDVVTPGDITATADADATGIFAVSRFGSHIDNGGAITATSDYGNATGVVANVFTGTYQYENAVVENNGSIVAHSQSGDATGVAIAADIAFAIAYNNGSIAASSSGQGIATGIRAASDASVSSTYVFNDGTISAASQDRGLAFGIDAYSHDADTFVINRGAVTATSGISSSAFGISALSQNGSTLVRNTSDITVTTLPSPIVEFTTDVDYATGIYAGSEDDSTVSNAGRIVVHGGWQALGIEGRSDDGLVTLENLAGGSITVVGSVIASGMTTYVNPKGYDPYTNDVVMSNAGDISVSTTGFQTDPGGFKWLGFATGMEAFLWQGFTADLVNTGTITVDAFAGARGMRADAITQSTLLNAGSISIEAQGYNSILGLDARSIDGDATVTNTGHITMLGHAATNADVATGLSAESLSRAGGAARATNSGDIDMSGSVTIYGIAADAGLLAAGDVFVTNTGTIRLSGPGTTWGINSNRWNGDGDSTVLNAGLISATGTDARGMRLGVLSADGGLLVTNSGDIEVVGATSPLFGINGSTGIFARRYAMAEGGIIDIDNSGTIRSVTDAGDGYAAFQGAHALGITALSYANDTTVSNSGDIITDFTASGTNSGASIGIFTKNGYNQWFSDTSITNTGDIHSTLVADDTFKPFTFLYYSGAYTAGVLARGTYGNADVSNAGAITASATSNSDAGTGVTRATGISLLSRAGFSGAHTFDMADLTVSNTATGTVRSAAIAEYGDSAVFATGVSGRVEVGAYAADLVSAGHGITLGNAGLVTANAAIATAASGNATAIGLLADNASDFGFAHIANSGTLAAEATAATGAATALGVSATAHEVTVALDGTGAIFATARGTAGSAVGLSAFGSAVIASNAGTIRAEFIGTGQAVGARIGSSDATVSFNNTGTIFATAGDAVGVQLDSLTATTLVNSGRITALSDDAFGVAVKTGDSDDLIQNSGVLDGALVTGGGNDTFENSAAGLWRAVGVSDFGSGQNTINNLGTIRLDGATVQLGTLGTPGTFSNAGTLLVSGNNTIAAGTGFSNTGSIDFRNAVATDRLVIGGDFTGGGAVNLDVDAANGTGDLLTIGGNVVGGATTLNLALLSLPTTASTHVQLVDVAGTSAANAFALGQVLYQPNQGFLDLTYTFTAAPVGGSQLAIAPTAVVPPVVPPVVVPPVVIPPVVIPPVTPTGPGGVDIGVAGLSDAGTLGASLAAGVQSLLGSEVGTWRQRMGVIDSVPQGSVALWARFFSDNGKVNPGHVASNFGQGGNFAFEQQNSGAEIGVDYAITDGLSVGALLAKSHAMQNLDGFGLGSSKIDGDTVGAYVTWQSDDGFYVDGSYRRMSFDATLRATGGNLRTSGDADALSVEAGYSWTVGDGLIVQPQLQYTKTEVDDARALPGTLATFESHGGDSSRGRAGVLLSKAFVGTGATWTPYASISAVREFDGKNSFSVNETFSGTTKADGTSALAEAGLGVQWGALSLYGGASYQDGGSLERVIGGQVGVRYAW